MYVPKSISSETLHIVKERDDQAQDKLWQHLCNLSSAKEDQSPGLGGIFMPTADQESHAIKN